MVSIIISDELEVQFKGGVDLDDLLLVIDSVIKRPKDVNIIAIDRNTLCIDGINYSLDMIGIKTINDVATEYVNAKSLYLKSIEECLPEPDDFPPLIKACIKAMRMTQPKVLTQSQHNRKLGHIRELIKIKDGQRASISMARLEELLSYYGLDITDMIKEKYLK